MDRILSAVLAFILLAMPGCQSTKTDYSYPWLVYYGASLSPADLKGVKLAILEPDHINPEKFNFPSTKFIGYLSLGEAAHTRNYWPLIAGKDFLVEPNPDWEGSWRVDARAGAWRKLILERILPDIFSKGYDGVFLDTIDTAPYLEWKDPEKYKGSREAMIGLIHEIRKRYPDKMILPNNGLEMLEEIALAVDGVVVEDLHTRHDFSLKKSAPTPLGDRDYKEKILDAFLTRHRKPVFNILYEADPRSELARSAIRRSREKGYRWYLTKVDLQSLGIIDGRE